MKDDTAIKAIDQNLEDQGIHITEIDSPEQAMMQTRSPYSTAVQVIKRRDIQDVLRDCIQEARMAGDSFYYSWSQGGKIIEGNTVGCALMMIRNWGNCAIDVKVQELAHSYIFYGAFIDLQTGFNLVRPFKMSKKSPVTKEGREIYKGDRGKDIIFQIGASKAIRNVALNALPKYITDEVLEVAKSNVVKVVEDMGNEEAIRKIVANAKALKIPMDRIEANYGKKENWNTVKIVAVMGAIRSVEDGIESADEIFSDKVAVNGEPEIVDKKKEKKKAEPEPEKSEPLSTTVPPDFFINQIEQSTTAKDVEKILKDKAVQTLGAGDKSKVDIAGMKRIKEIKELIKE